MARVAGYGYRPGVATPYGRRADDVAGEVADTPTSDWASLIESGYRAVRGVLIDGIPYALGEHELTTVRGGSAEPPSDVYTMSYALMILQGLAYSCEIDREAGVASARALDLHLRRETMEDDGLLTALFKTPALSAVLQTTVQDPDANSFEVDSTTSWTNEGRAYIGRECIDYTALGTEGPLTASLDGITRGVAGMPHYHSASGLSGYATVTDVPQSWVGRTVTWFDHLVSPEGRYLGDRWCAVGTYCRQLWRGQIDEDPQDTSTGKVFRCLPAVRLAGQEIGAKLDLEVALDGTGNPMLWFTAADKIAIHSAGTSLASGPSGVFDEFATLDAWCSKAASDISAAVTGTVSITAPWRPPSEILVVAQITGATAPYGSVRASAWFLRDGSYGAGTSQDPETMLTRIPVDLDGAPVQWLVLRSHPSEEVSVTDIPESGTAAIESGNVREIIRWQGTKTVANPAQADLIALRVVERQVNGTSRAGLFTWGGKVTIISGSTGSWSDVFRELMTSSGTGARGDFDRLGYGYGIGFPDAWIDTDALATEPLATQQVSAAADERRSIIDVIGGWLALWSRCLVQRRNAAGEIVLSPVSTVVTDDPLAETIDTSDVLLGTHGTPKVLQAPNTIVAKSSGYGIDSSTIIYRDRSRVQAEGQRAWSLLTPGITREVVSQHAPDLTIRTQGMSAVSFEAPPWWDGQPGDRRTLTTAHPTVYDWSTGAYGPATINSVIAAVEHDIYSDVFRVRLLLEGRSAALAELCPTARVIRLISTSEIEVEAGDELHFEVGDEIEAYEPGNEAATTAAATITAIDTTTHIITLDAAVTPAPNLHMTYADYTAVATDQQRRMFVRTDKRWR